MTGLLKLYPRSWRERYGAEMEEVVAAHPPSVQLVFDLLGGAVDAHFNPQALASRLERERADDEGGLDMIDRLRGCAAASLSTRDSMVAGALTIGVALAVVALMAVVEALAPPSAAGDQRISNVVLLTMTPAILTIPTQWAYLRGRSRAVRAALIAGPLVVCFLIGLGTGIYVNL